MTNTISLPEAIETAQNNMLIDLHTAFVGEVVSYDADSQTATIRPVTRRPVLAQDINDGEDVVEEIPNLPNVPVIHPRGNDTFVHVPLTAGDAVLVVCCQFDISNWRSTGRVSDPATPALHDLSNCVAFPGAFHDATALASSKVSSTNITIGNGDMLVTVKNGSVEFNGNSDAAALASKVDNLQSNLNSFIAAYNAHKHTGVTTGMGSSAISDTLATSSSETFASDRIKTDS